MNRLILAFVLGAVVSANTTSAPAGVLAHFGKGGQILTTYMPGESIWVRSIFNTEARKIDSVAFHAAAVTDLEQGYYDNPVDMGPPCNNAATYDLAQCERAWLHNFWAPAESWARANRFQLLVLGDGIFRDGAEFGASSGYAAAMVPYETQRAQSGHQVLAIEGIDEANGPISPSVRAIINNMRSGVHPPITWPVGSFANHPADDLAWMGDPTLADYATHYTSYPDPQTAEAILPTYEYQSNTIMPSLDKAHGRPVPHLLEISCAGPMYTKKTNESNYTLGVDQLLHPGVTPQVVTAEIMYAVARGYAGVRSYSYDWDNWVSQRATSPVGTEGLQTGCSPTGQGSDRWAAQSAAFNLIKHLEPYILQPAMTAPAVASPIIGGAKHGRNVTLVTLVNFSSNPHRIGVDLRSYSLGGSVMSYRLIGSNLTNVSGYPAASSAMQPLETDVVIFTR